jgi:hypothetical protein
MELSAFIYQPEVRPLQNGGFGTALASEYWLAYD